MKGPASAAFRLDATPAIGGGHAMRCLTLAQSLAAAGTKTVFFVNREAPDIVPALGASGQELRVVTSRPEDFSRSLTQAFPRGADLVVFDHYGLNRDDELRIAPFCHRIMVVDDLADRRHYCDILLDQTVGRHIADYENLINPGSHMLIGSDYALIRPEFARLRPVSLGRRDGTVRSVFVSMGLTDLGAISAKIIQGLSTLPHFSRLDVLLAPAALSHDAVSALASRDQRITVHGPDADIPRLMTEADIAVGAAGTTSWERCCLGLPTILMELADNQAHVVTELVRRGAVVKADDAAAVPARLVALLGATDAVKTMSASAAALVDGKGINRLCEAIENMPWITRTTRQ